MAKLSSFLTYVSTTIAVALIVISFSLFQSSEKLENYLKGNINITVFLKDSAEKYDVKIMEQGILQTGFIAQAEYISKEEAVEIFIRETGEDFRRILDYNPLPASFNLKLKSQYADQDSLKKIIRTLTSFSWIEEVVHRDDFIQKLLSYIKEFKLYVFALTIIILLVSLYLVFSTVRLIINSRTEEFETMKLVGARLSTIKMPIIINGFLIGLFSAISVGILFYLILSYAGNYISSLKVMNFDKFQYYLVILCSGTLLSVFLTIFSLRKLTLKVNY